jgi:hypothetical protein
MRPQNFTHPEEIMKSDLLSEILLAGSGLILFVPLLLILLAALNQWA